jgi:hypothetical protein
LISPQRILNMKHSFQKSGKSSEKPGMGYSSIQRVFIIFLVILAITSCKDTGGKIEGSVTSGVLDDTSKDSSKIWDFSSSGDYTFDSKYVQVSGNKASLKTVSTIFNSSATFNSGTYDGTYFNSSSLTLSQSDQSELSSTWTPKYSALVGYWKFNGTVGALANSATVTAAIGPNLTSQSTDSTGIDYVDGKLQQGLSLVGVSNDSLLSQATSFSLNSVAFWFKFSQVRTVGSSANSVVFLNSQVWFKVGGNGTGTCTNEMAVVGGGTGERSCWVDGSATFDQSWHHIIYVWDAVNTTYKVFLDGIEKPVTTVGTMSLATLSSNTLEVNHDQGNGQITIDDLAIWNESLTQTDIQTIYQRQSMKYSGDTSLDSTWTPRFSSLIGYWQMDGNWLDSSGNGHDGVAEGGVAISSTSKIGSQSASFTGSTDAVNVGSLGELNAPSQVSGCAWVYHTTTSNDDVIFSNWDGANQGISLFRDEVGGVSGRTDIYTIFIKDASGVTRRIESKTNASVLNTWTHVCFTFQNNSATGLRLYVDGNEDPNSGVTTVGLTSADWSARASRVGWSNDNSLTFMGNIDDVAIWSTVLSSSDIALIYNRQKQKYAGSYESPIIDMGASSATWKNFSSVTSLPFYKELAGVSGSDNASSYTAITGDLSNGLVAYFPFNGNNADAMGNTVNTGGSTTENFVDGPIGKARQTSGNHKIYIPAASAPDPEAYTLAFWIKGMPATTAYTSIARKINYNNSGWVLQQNNLTGGVSFRMDTNHTSLADITACNADPLCNQTTSTTSTILNGEWNHIVFTMDKNLSDLTNSPIKIYVNGKLEKSSTYKYGSGFGSPGNDLEVWTQTSMASSRDEIAIWSRALSSDEVLELYRRGANRVKYQVHSCVDSSCNCKSYSTTPVGSESDCDGDGIVNASDTTDAYKAEWIGPDGTASTYFSELQNNASVDSSGNPTGLVNLTGLTLDWAGTFFTSAARPTSNRYFQYRVYMESDDKNNLCSGAPCIPEVTSIAVGPSNRYYGGSPAVVNNTPLSYSQLKSITRSDSGSCTTYQISSDNGSTWKWWNGSAWTSTSGGVSTSNYLSDLTSEHLQDLSSGSFKFKAFLNTNTSGDFSQSCDLSSVGITYKP